MWSALRYVDCMYNECSDTTPAGSVVSRLICENLNPFPRHNLLRFVTICYGICLDFLMYVLFGFSNVRFSSIKSTKNAKRYCITHVTSTHLLTFDTVRTFFSFSTSVGRVRFVQLYSCQLIVLIHQKGNQKYTQDTRPHRIPKIFSFLESTSQKQNGLDQKSKHHGRWW